MIDYHILVQFLEENYAMFLAFCDPHGGESVADDIINGLRREGGMGAEAED